MPVPRRGEWLPRRRPTHLRSSMQATQKSWAGGNLISSLISARGADARGKVVVLVGQFFNGSDLVGFAGHEHRGCGLSE
jgi:hypothetical protein